MRRVLVAIALFATSDVARTEPPPLKALLGTREGDIQGTRGRTSNDRTLVVESVGDGGGAITAQ